MRCPKCGYISFDYNQTCPKCNKDITAEVAKLNLPSYKPNPPSLLGALTGDVNETNIGILKETSTGIGAIADGAEVSLDDSSEIDTGEMVFDEGQDLDVSLQPEELDVSLQPGGTEEETEIREDQEEISLDLDETSAEEPEPKDLKPRKKQYNSKKSSINKLRNK